jgi:hypothetical protein
MRGVYLGVVENPLDFVLGNLGHGLDPPGFEHDFVAPGGGEGEGRAGLCTDIDLPAGKSTGMRGTGPTFSRVTPRMNLPGGQTEPGDRPGGVLLGRLRHRRRGPLVCTGRCPASTRRPHGHLARRARGAPKRRPLGGPLAAGDRREPHTGLAGGIQVGAAALDPARGLLRELGVLAAPRSPARCSDGSSDVEGVLVAR